MRKIRISLIELVSSATSSEEEFAAFAERHGCRPGELRAALRRGRWRVL